MLPILGFIRVTSVTVAQSQSFAYDIEGSRWRASSRLGFAFYFTALIDIFVFSCFVPSETRHTLSEVTLLDSLYG